MKEIFEKSIIGTITFVGIVISVYFGIGCDNKLKTVIYVSSTLSFIIIYLWYSYHALKNKENLLKLNNDLELKIKEMEKDLKRLDENNKGLLDERKNYQRRIENKDDKIYNLEKEIRELQTRIIFNERRK